jgi:hypothetical protein
MAARHITDDDLELYAMDRLADAMPVEERYAGGYAHLLNGMRFSVFF